MNTSVNDNRTNVSGNARPLTKLNNKENKSIKGGLSSTSSMLTVKNNYVKVKTKVIASPNGNPKSVGISTIDTPFSKAEGMVSSSILEGTGKHKSVQRVFPGSQQRIGLTDSDLIETKFITKLMRKGKKEKAEMTLLKALKKVEQELLKKESVTLTSTSSMASAAASQKVSKSVASTSSLTASSTASMSLKKPSSSPKVIPISLGSSEGIDIREADVIPEGHVDEVSTEKQTHHQRVSTSSMKLNTKVSTASISLSKLLERIIENAKPLVRLKKVRIAGTTHQKPVALTKKQAEADAIKRIITNAKARSEKSATLKLAKEFEEIYLNVMSNKTLTEVRELHKLAEVNKANITLK